VRPLDSINNIKQYDKSGMLELIESFPDQCQDALRIGYEFQLPEGFKTKYKNIVCIGLGGSAIGADLVRSYIVSDAEVPLFVSRNYTLPNFADNQTLVVASSYSGNTEEVLSAYRDARNRDCTLVAITSGGKLSQIARHDGAVIINIPAGLPPRAALGYSFFPLLILLSKIGIIKDQAFFIDDTIRVLRKLKNERLGHKIKDNQAKRIAGEIYGKLPVIYSGLDHMDSVVTRWRGQLAENSKTLASSNFLPEMNHNEIVGWENPRPVLKNSIVIMLRDAADHPRVSKRMDITKKILKKEKISVIEVRSAGKELLARMFSLVYIGDYVSFYLAVLNKIDPSPVERISYMKRELSK
jgi:glucose/mannose-6-phosphate isomerase